MGGSMKKRSLALLLGAIMIAFPAGGDVKAASEEIVELVWHYPTAGEFGQGFKDVEAALNEMLEKDIGVHVTFEPCVLGKSHQDAALARQLL